MTDVSTKHGCAALCIEITDYWRKRGLTDAVATPVCRGEGRWNRRFDVECNVHLVKAADGWRAVTA